MASNKTTWDEFFDKKNELIWTKLDHEVAYYLKKYKLSYDEKNDIKQDILEKLHNKQAKTFISRDIKKIKSEGDFQGYVYKMVKNAYYDLIKHNKRQQKLIGEFSLRQKIQDTQPEDNRHITYSKLLKPHVDEFAKNYILSANLDLADKLILIRCFSGCEIETICDNEDKERIKKIQNMVSYRRKHCAQAFRKCHVGLIDKENHKTEQIILWLLGQRRFLK
ncbi:hypothetical protein [Seonamhaeicola sp.]|uniref:RNA polymerase sigma factor n=1 Tax=Seonamhaeicola sp. TaxID=1912245 RepID=UPI00260D04BF|nr:hypothetical protein [Seonamhaeicola sp.]